MEINRSLNTWLHDNLKNLNKTSGQTSGKNINDSLWKERKQL